MAAVQEEGERLLAFLTAEPVPARL
jgi:hypothetical protein